MESQKILDAMEEGIVKAIRSGEPFNIPYQAKISVSDQIAAAYKQIDFTRVQAQIVQCLEEELARKVVNKVITEMGTDIKKLMCNAEIRDDFRYLLRKGMEELLGRVTKEKEKGAS
jgi:hypothetical protein